MVFTDGTCGHCGLPFRYPQNYGVVRYCSANCRVQKQPPQSPWEYKGCTSTRYHSKSRRRAIQGGDAIDPLVVYIVFDWTCHLCHAKIDPTLRMPDERCATVDHIIPLGQGGTHTWDNVAPAHKVCNEDKDKLLYGVNKSINSERLPVPVS